MLQIKTNQATKIDSIWHEYYNLYKSDIDIVLDKLWKQEDLFGRSNLNYRLLQYQLAFNYVTLLFVEYERRIDTEWAYYESKYELTKYRKVFACNNISLDKILELFNLPYIDSKINQIEGGELQSDFGVEVNMIDEVEEEITPIDILGMTSTSTAVLSINTLSSLCPVKCNPTICGEECGESAVVYVESEDDELIETEDGEYILED